MPADLPEGALEAFRRGLYPILRAGDVAAFRRYLARWEHVVGDTSELAQTPIEQQRRIMLALLHQPQQFSLPPWPPHGFDDAAQAEPAARAALEQASSPERPSLKAAVLEEPGRRAAPEPASPQEPGPARGETRFFQIDMLTGELVPVTPPALPLPAEAPVSVPRRRRRRARSPLGLRQLPLWPQEPAAGDDH